MKTAEEMRKRKEEIEMYETEANALYAFISNALDEVYNNYNTARNYYILRTLESYKSNSIRTVSKRLEEAGYKVTLTGTRNLLDQICELKIEW
jgi:hypothetical protein